MNNWLVVLSEDNWVICARERLLGLGRDAERRLSRMSVGDRIWVYINRKYVDHATPRVYEIRATAIVTGPVRHLANSPWHSRGRQHFSTARPIRVERNIALPARELLMSMSFAGRLPFWGLRLLHAPIRLTSDDVSKFDNVLKRLP